MRVGLESTLFIHIVVIVENSCSEENGCWAKSQWGGGGGEGGQTEFGSGGHATYDFESSDMIEFGSNLREMIEI